MGSFVAAMLIMGMYHEEIWAYYDATVAAGLPVVSASGPAGILCAFPGPKQKNLGWLFLLVTASSPCEARRHTWMAR
jgi:hypothetical protein